MLRKWFNTREAAEAGAALADRFPVPPKAVSAAPGKQEWARRKHGEALRDFLRRATGESRALGLNFFKRAWFANSFKWRLLENGVDADTANEWTQTIVLEISSKRTQSAPGKSPLAQPRQPLSYTAQSISRLGDESYARGDYAEAVTHYQDLAVLKPHDPAALNMLGAALGKLGRYQEAEDQFGKAIGLSRGTRESGVCVFSQGSTPASRKLAAPCPQVKAERPGSSVQSRCDPPQPGSIA
jgi:tetratricopeptide (TPR) repeat protein